MKSKTKEFKLNEIVQFGNELIYFFNINPYNASIYVSLETNGKKIKLDYSDKIILKEIFQNESTEINYNIIKDVQLNMIFKIVNKFNKKDIFESFQTKMRESKVLWNQKKLNEGAIYGGGISIKDRIKMFSGGDKSKKQNTTSNYKPGKLKMPNIFQTSNKNSIKSSHSNISKEEVKKSIKKESLKNLNKLENKEEIKDLNKIHIRKSDIVQNNNKIEKNNNEKIMNKEPINKEQRVIKNENEKEKDNNKNSCKIENNNKMQDNNEEIENKNNIKKEKSDLVDIEEKKENEIKNIGKNTKEIKNEEEKMEIKEEKNKNEIKEKSGKETQNIIIKNEQKEEAKENKDEKNKGECDRAEEEDNKEKIEDKKEENKETKIQEIKEENKDKKVEIIENKEENEKEESNLNDAIENNVNKDENIKNEEIKTEKKEEEKEDVDFKTALHKKEEENIDKFDEAYLYEEREYFSNEEEEQEMDENEVDNIINNFENKINRKISELNEEKENPLENNNDTCINIDKEIQKKEDKKETNIDNDNDNKIKYHESGTFQKEIPGLKNNDETQEKIQHTPTSKNFATSLQIHQKPKGAPSFKSNSGDIFLESMNYSSYLKNLQKKGLKESKRETFCEGFFIASFPFKNGSVIEKSQQFPAVCGHEECSKLPSMKPEIISRYPLKDTKNLEMNNLAATICFPTGIKVCYSEDKPANIKDYVTPITNQKGERYYMMTHHFYRKITRDEYDKKYEMHPLKYHLMKFGDAYLSLSEDELDDTKINEIQKSLEFCQELGFRDYLYIPYCLCIISKYPYVNELKKCLKSIYRILSKEKLITYLNPEEGYYEINHLIMHLIHSIPIPDPNSMVKFFLPYYNKRLEITCPKIEDISVMNSNACTLLQLFSVEHIITIYKLILNEKKILFVDKYYDRLSKVTDGFISILYPLQWVHTYIPIMSDQMLKYLETFLPFLNGIHDSLMPLVKDILYENDLDSEEIFLIYINGDKIKLGSSLNGKKVKVDKYIQENIPPFPSDLEKKLKNKLKKMKNEFSGGLKKEITMDSETAELKMRDAFIDFFLEMFHDYEKYLYLLDDQDVVFNKSLFLNNVPNNEKKFYNEIIDSQLFQQFTQNIIKEDFNYFYNKKDLREKEKEKEKNKKKDKKKKEEKEEKSVQKPIILNNYVVSPFYLNIKDTEVRNIEANLRKKYPVAIKDIETERILKDLAEIDPNKFINESCLIFLTPEQIKAEKGNFKDNTNLDLRKSAIPKLTGNLRDMKLKMNVKLSTKSTMIESEKYNERKREEMKEYIRDFVAKIFKSEINNIDNTEKSDLLNIIETSHGREYFISLLSHNTGNIVLLQINSFKLLGNLIYNALIGTLKIEETDKVLEEIVLLIKSTKYFGMKEKGITVTIFDDYKKKIQSTPKIVQYNFWKKRYDIELKNKESKNDDCDKQQIIYVIVDQMIELEIPKGLIKTIVDKISNEAFGKDSQLTKETFKIFVQQITKARYVSKEFKEYKVDIKK